MSASTRLRVIIIIALALLVCSPLCASAGQPYSCSYTLSATSPEDDPSTSAIETGPGTAITVEADATGTYSGPIPITLPSLNVNLLYELKHGGSVIDTKKDSYPVNSMRIEPGRTYSQTGSKSYTLPSGLAPGDYALECTAAISVFGIGHTEHASFPVKITGGPSSGTRSVPPGAISAYGPAEASNELAKLCAYPVDLRQYAAEGLI